MPNLDFNDGYLAPGETCHPSDNLGAVLAAAEYGNRSGKRLLTALAAGLVVGATYHLGRILFSCAPALPPR